MLLQHILHKNNLYVCGWKKVQSRVNEGGGDTEKVL